ncbi:MAG: hypothetical protein IK076_02865 [Bacteroidales bacterium]|nr:hypothetical protein [Bacteroidales bacterium]
MGNIDEKSLSSLLGRIEDIKKELEVLENKLKELAVEPIPQEAVPEEPVFEGPAVEEPAPEAPARETPAPEVPVPEEPVIDEPALEEAIPEEPVFDEPALGEPVPEDPAVPEPAPIDIAISDVEMPVPPVVEPVEVEEAPAIEDEEPVDVVEVPEVEDVAFTKKAILDSAVADTAVMDVMAEKQAWRTDRPGMPVKNIISAISLNDRVLLINVLFNEDPMLFQDAIARFNSMGSFKEALEYIEANYPGWDMNSEPVYRLMMAIRRKLA